MRRKTRQASRVFGRNASTKREVHLKQTSIDQKLENEFRESLLPLWQQAVLNPRKFRKDPADISH